MRLIVVSNRLPVTVAEEDDGISFRESAGGLVTGLSSLLSPRQDHGNERLEYAWIGWPGTAVPDREKAHVRDLLLQKFHSHPVFVSVRSMDKFYLGFCNRTIWPLFHYFSTYAVYDSEYWTQYKRVNELFRDAVLEVARPDDVIWVQDYHLMLLPGLIRQRLPEARIGFFLHIPFPSFETFRLLPGDWRRQILIGLLGSDVVGFHTHDYTGYFVRCISRILGYDTDMGRILVGQRVVKADTFPMGIDFRLYNEAGKSGETRDSARELRKSLGTSKVVLSIDRLDYTKGTLNRLRGYELFLEENPDWRGNVVLALVVVPSRVGVEDYVRTKRQIDELVGKINGTYGTLRWTPVVYQYTSLPFPELVTLYSASDVALVTPLRDGMNLIAKEYVAARANKTGVLILSEMAGASQEMGEAITINPNDVGEITAAIKQAVTMPKDEQITRNEIMQTRLRRYDVHRWAEDFIQSLLRTKAEQANLAARMITPDVNEYLIGDFLRAEKRLLLLDYEGTLTPVARQPQLAKPDEQSLRILDLLSQDRKNEVVLISRRKRSTLQQWFGHLNIGLIAEDGVWVKEPGGRWSIVQPLSNQWKRAVLPILEMQVDRLPGSFIEEREYSAVWNYRNANTELASVRASEVMDALVAFTANVGVQVLQGHKDIQVRSGAVNKGTACLHLIGRKEFDFVLAIGDDATDEELFRAVAQSAYTIRVGLAQSLARFNLPDTPDVQKLLDDLASAGSSARKAS